MPGGLDILMGRGLSDDPLGRLVLDPNRNARRCSPHPSGVGGPYKTLEDQARIEVHEKVMTMRDRLLRRRQVEEITGMSRSSIYRLMQDGEFPRPVKVGCAAVRWRESDITGWLESRPEG